MIEIELGSAPSDELCVQTTDPDYEEKALAECKRYKELLLSLFREAHGRDPECRVLVKGNSHDFGTYYEVVAKGTNEEDVMWFDNNAPANWA